jgi:hypothetical protein
MHPTGAQAVYPGVANVSIADHSPLYKAHGQPSTSNANVIEDIPSKDSVAAASDDTTDAAKGPSRDTIEAKPGLIETTELAPLGEEKVVADRK